MEGPFETNGEVIDDVVVRFLIIGDEQTVPMFGTATVPASAMTKSAPPDVVSRGRFSSTVADCRFTAGAKVRAIGISVAVKRADPPDPPAFETFTWCVKFEVTAVQAST